MEETWDQQPVWKGVVEGPVRGPVTVTLDKTEKYQLHRSKGGQWKGKVGMGRGVT